MRTIFTVALFFTLLVCIWAQNPPALPQAFSTSFTVSIDLLPTNPFLAGQIQVNYPKNASSVYFEDSGPLGNPPFLFQTTTIVHPLDIWNSSVYQFLWQGRCWQLPNVSTSDIEVLPLSVPAGSELLNNQTIDGDLYGIWGYDGPYAIYLSMAVRWSDGALGFILLHNNLLIEFILTIDFHNFDPTPPPDSEFAVPAGPCPPAPIYTPGASLLDSALNPIPFARSSEDSILVHILKGMIHFRRLFNLFNTLQSEPNVGRKESPLAFSEPSPIKSAPTAPTPPVLHQYFSAHYRLGYGVLSAANNWQGNNSQGIGFLAIDKEFNGAYINVNDDQTADVPFQFSTAAIISPLSTSSQTELYFSVAPGRCWNMGTGNWSQPSIPLTIPANATYNGTAMINGVSTTIWSFAGELNGYSGEVSMGIADSNNAIVFASVESLGFGTWVTFTNFDDSRPPASWYAPPPGPCFLFGDFAASDEEYMLEKIVASFI